MRKNYAYNICKIGVPEGEQDEKKETLFEEIITETESIEQ